MREHGCCLLLLVVEAATAGNPCDSSSKRGVCAVRSCCADRWLLLSLQPVFAAVFFFFTVQRHLLSFFRSSSSPKLTRGGCCILLLLGAETTISVSSFPLVGLLLLSFFSSPRLPLLLVSTFSSAFYSLFSSFSFFPLPFPPLFSPVFFFSFRFCCFCYFSLPLSLSKKTVCPSLLSPFLFFSSPPPSRFPDSIYRGRGTVTDPAPSHLCTCMERAVPLVCHGTGRGGHWRRRLRDTTSLSSHHEEVRVASEEEEGETVPSKNGTVLYIYIYILENA